VDFSLQGMELVVGLGGESVQTLQKLSSVSQSNSVLQKAALFIVIFSTHNVREPEVFADSILYFHTLKTLVIVLNNVNLWRLQNWAGVSQEQVFSWPCTLQTALSPGFQGGIGRVVECRNRKKFCLN